MKTTKMRVVPACAVLLMLLGPCAAWADVSVVASAKSSLATLTNDQAADVFLGKASAFPDGRKTHLVDLPEASPVRAAFYEKLCGKNASQMKAYWSRLMFTGKGLPPQEVGDADAVKKALAADPDAIGYIDAGAVDSSVKVLATVK